MSMKPTNLTTLSKYREHIARSAEAGKCTNKGGTFPISGSPITESWLKQKEDLPQETGQKYKP